MMEKGECCLGKRSRKSCPLVSSSSNSDSDIVIKAKQNRRPKCSLPREGKLSSVPEKPEESDIRIVNIDSPYSGNVEEIHKYFDDLVSLKESAEGESVNCKKLGATKNTVRTKTNLEEPLSFLYSAEGGGVINIQKDLLGTGSFSEVRIANIEDDRGNTVKVMAVKILNAIAASSSYVDKFLRREITILLKLQHPNIIATQSIFLNSNKIYVLMELANNGDLLEYLQTNGTVEETQCRQWFSQISDALLYCHNSKIAHRDLKCENIVIDSTFGAKLCDFGLARFFDPSASPAELSETFCGTLEYASPEIIGQQPYDPMLSDVWSLGICLYAMLNRTTPFEARIPENVLKIQRQRDWCFRPSIKEKVSRSVQDLVQNMLEPDAHKRPIMEKVCYHPWVRGSVSELP